MNQINEAENSGQRAMSKTTSMAIEVYSMSLLHNKCILLCMIGTNTRNMIIIPIVFHTGGLHSFLPKVETSMCKKQ